MNDINILSSSDHFSSVLCGSFPSSLPFYKIGSERFDWYYDLADGIYPCWKIFIRPIQGALTPLEKAFNRVQEGCRKCVERIFGVSFRQFKFLFVLSEFLSPEKMELIAKTCVIMHNIIVEARRDGYSGDGGRGIIIYFENDVDESDLEVVHVTTNDHEERLGLMAHVINNIASVSEDIRLRRALNSDKAL